MTRDEMETALVDFWAENISMEDLLDFYVDAQYEWLKQQPISDIENMLEDLK